MKNKNPSLIIFQCIYIEFDILKQSTHTPSLIGIVAAQLPKNVITRKIQLGDKLFIKITIFVYPIQNEE